MADKFPLELVRKIIANLDDYHDKDTLKAAALAGSLLRGLCQEQLFSSIHAVGHTERGSETRCLRLLKLFHKSPVLATYVRTVHIHAHDAGWVEDDFLPKLLTYLADVGLVTRFFVGVMDFQWVKPPVEVQEAITRLMLSPSIKSMSIEGVPIDHLDLGNPSVKEVTLLSTMDHPKRSIFRSIHSESEKKAELLRLTISQSEPLVSTLMKPESGISWSSLRELTLKLDLLHGSSHIPELNAMLTAVGPTLGFFQFEAELLRNPNQIIDLSMLTNLRCLGILHSASLSKMLGMSMGTRQLQNPFLESLQFLLETACTDYLRTIGICTGAALRAMPNGPAQTPSWDIDLEINRHKAWASLIKMITNKDRFPCMKEFVVMGFGVEESIRKHLPQIDATGMLMVDTKNAPPPPMAGFEFVSVGPGPHGGPPGGPHGAPGHGPTFGHGTAPGQGHDDDDDDYDPHHGHGHSHGHEHGSHDHSHDHGHGGHGHSHDQPGGGGYHTHDLGHFYFGGPGQNFQDYGGESHSHYGHSLDSLN